MAPNSIHWFRKGLRLHDNPALQEALRGAGTIRCVYFLDPWFAGSSNLGVNRWRFLLQCLDDLDSSLRKLNSRLFVIRGQPANVFPRLFKEWEISRLTFEYDSEPFGKERDAAIKKLAMEAGVEVIVKISHTLYNLDKIIELNGSQPPLTYKRFQTLISRMDPPEMPMETLSSSLMGCCVTPISEDHGDKYGVPSLEELGFDTEGLPSAVWPGGETEALTRIERHLERKAWVANFERPRMNANSLLASPTGLSPYLRFGCLSCRLFYFKLTDLYRKVKKTSTPPLSLYGQLLWREFFYTAATTNPRFDKMEGNPICVRIPWDKNPEALAKWAEAKTGFPWIDAIMTQLRQEGWIHHLARHAVACFLTRGDLWISWEEGMKVFEELLLDADWSVNAGSWMWLSCSSFFQQFFHCYCPVGFGRRTDPNGDFIRRYLPILRGFPAKYIYDPWNAPDAVQTAAKCIIGVHYPKPMVNHAEASRLNIERMKQIYQQLSRYRGLGKFLHKKLCLGLLASVPSTHNGNGNGMAYSPGEQQSGTNTPAPVMPGTSATNGNRSGSILLNFEGGEHQGPSRMQQQQKLGETETMNCVSEKKVVFVSQHSTQLLMFSSVTFFSVSGRAFHTAGRVTCKRERESERDAERDDTLSTSHKLQRQIAITTVHGANGSQPDM
ncbi:cryptochrome-1 isoform 2, partial [Silurus asotus]